MEVNSARGKGGVGGGGDRGGGCGGVRGDGARGDGGSLGGGGSDGENGGQIFGSTNNDCASNVAALGWLSTSSSTNTSQAIPAMQTSVKHTPATATLIIANLPRLWLALSLGPPFSSSYSSTGSLVDRDRDGRFALPGLARVGIGGGTDGGLATVVLDTAPRRSTRVPGPVAVVVVATASPLSLLMCDTVFDALSIGRSHIAAASSTCPTAPPRCNKPPSSCTLYESCGCVLVRPSGCSDDCKSLDKLVRHARGRDDSYGRCKFDGDCGHGYCASGRWRCHLIGKSNVLRYGGHNCSVDNRVGADESNNNLYSEKTMGQWYNENQIAAARGKDAAQQKAGDTSMSGRGSTAESTVGVRAVLPRLIELFNIVSIADVPCGDFNYMREILSSQAMRSRPLKYVGGDIVSKLVTRLNTLHGDGERVSFMRLISIGRHYGPSIRSSSAICSSTFREAACLGYCGASTIRARGIC